MQSDEESEDWLYNRILFEVMNDLADRYRAMLDTISEFESYIDRGINKINAAEWSAEFYGGEPL